MAENNRINKNIGQSGTRRGPKANTPARMSDIEDVRSELSTSVGAIDTLYSADGTLASDRTVDGNGTAGLFEVNLKDHSIESNDRAKLQSVNNATVRSTTGDVLLTSDAGYISHNGFYSLVTEKFTLTAADVRALNSTPYNTVLGTTNKVNKFVDAFFVLQSDGTAFATGGDIRVIDTGTSNPVSVDLAAASLYNTVDKAYMIPSIATATEVGIGDKLAITAAADFTLGGNSTLDVYITYRLFDA